MDNLRRRSLLSSLALAAVAGCLDGSETAEIGGSTTTDDEESSNSSTGESGASTESFSRDEPQAPEPEEEPQTLDTERDETNETTESDDEEEAVEEALMSAHGHIEDALERYAGFAGVNTTILDVGLETSISHSDVRQTTRNAQEELEAVRGESDVETAEQTVEWVDAAVACDRYLSDGYDALEDALDEVFDKRPYRADVSALSDAVDGARDALKDLPDGDLVAVDGLDADTREAKEAQLEESTDALAAFADALDAALPHIDEFYRGVDMHYSGDLDSRPVLGDVRRGLEDVDFDEETAGQVDALETMADDVACHLSSVESAADDLNSAGYARAGNNEERGKSLESRAEEALAECDRSVQIP